MGFKKVKRIDFTKDGISILHHHLIKTAIGL
ncbi:hypothetical protein PEPS_19530 [Persicobacter psychrovividus]|uniref:Uncharacterized protein n=1 Tax=Persicobacter psychrovividus TaxID=387638 RepID=A0ABN6L8X4_9BACT|nr:hypothetical protein PEPS_19530 [Persicobacter psychrovividus]